MNMKSILIVGMLALTLAGCSGGDAGATSTPAAPATAAAPSTP